MEQSSTWKNNRFLASQKIPHILWKPKVYYQVYNSPSSVPVLTQINPVCALYPISWGSIVILSSHISLGLASGHFPTSLLTKTLHAPLLSPIRATCPANFILLEINNELYSSINMAISRDQLKSSNKFLSQCYFFCHKCQMDCPVFEPCSVLWEAGSWPPEL